MSAKRFKHYESSDTDTHHLPRATLIETGAVVLEVLLPNVGKGVIIRRPGFVKLAEYLKLDTRAVRRVQQLQAKYGEGPLLLRIPFLKFALVLVPEHARQVLEHSPDPFATAETLKTGALAHFQPQFSLISHGKERKVRRNLQERVLEPHEHTHRYAQYFLPAIQEETTQLLREVKRTGGVLTWELFIDAWNKIVRRISFGDDARNDQELTNMLTRLRRDANWSFFKPRQEERRQKFLAHLEKRLENAQQGSLAYIMKHVHKHEAAAPVQQIPQWLFAYEPAGMAVMRTLALLTTHPKHMHAARHEVAEDESGRAYLPYLRTCVLESLRLWPTTPLLLRETTREVAWDNGVIAPNTSVLLFAPYLHRDDRHLPHAHDFFPAHWQDEAVPPGWLFVPFSDGPGECPGKQLVLLTTSAMLAAMIDNNIELASPSPLSPDKPLPGTLDNFSLRFAFK